MSDMSEYESDYFETIDDRILMGGKSLQGTIDKIADEFIERIDERGRPLFDQFAGRILEVCMYEGGDDPEVGEVAYKTFSFAKLIGFFALQPDHAGISLDGITESDAGFQTNSNVLVALISASMGEMKNSPEYSALIKTYRSKLDPTGRYSEVVDLFAGFSLFMMHNSLYHASDLERMQLAGDEIAEASDEDWQRGIEGLLGE